MTLVDIAGYFDVFATFKVSLQDVTFDGATKREAEIEQSPVSDHVFLPLEIVLTKNDSGVFDFFTT